MKQNYIFLCFALFSVEAVLAEKLTCGKQIAERVEAIGVFGKPRGVRDATYRLPRLY